MYHPILPEPHGPCANHVAPASDTCFVQARAALVAQTRALPPDQRDRVRLPPPQMAGGRGMDWVAVEAGGVTAHVLTEEARKFYRLEELFS